MPVEKADQWARSSLDDHAVTNPAPHAEYLSTYDVNGVASIPLTSPNGTIFLLTVDNSGNPVLT